MTLDEAIDITVKIADAARQIRKDILVICHGGPFNEPENVKEAMRRMPGINGFFGASSMERLPVKAQSHLARHSTPECTAPKEIS